MNPLAARPGPSSSEALARTHPAEFYSAPLVHLSLAQNPDSQTQWTPCPTPRFPSRKPRTNQARHPRQASRTAADKDRKSTRLNSSHRCISYAVFCLKKKKKKRLMRCLIEPCTTRRLVPSYSSR